jgi:hypothetical protein
MVNKSSITIIQACAFGICTTRAHRGPQIEAIQGAVDTSALKQDRTRLSQPSDSPNNPYNWPRVKKELFCLAYAFGCGAVRAVGPLLNPALFQASAEFDSVLSRI